MDSSHTTPLHDTHRMGLSLSFFFVCRPREKKNKTMLTPSWRWLLSILSLVCIVAASLIWALDWLVTYSIPEEVLRAMSVSQRTAAELTSNLIYDFRSDTALMTYSNNTWSSYQSQPYRWSDMVRKTTYVEITNYTLSATNWYPVNQFSGGRCRLLTNNPSGADWGGITLGATNITNYGSATANNYPTWGGSTSYPAYLQLPFTYLVTGCVTAGETLFFPLTSLYNATYGIHITGGNITVTLPGGWSQYSYTVTPALNTSRPFAMAIACSGGTTRSYSIYFWPEDEAQFISNTYTNQTATNMYYWGGAYSDSNWYIFNPHTMAYWQSACYVTSLSYYNTYINTNDEFKNAATSHLNTNCRPGVTFSTTSYTLFQNIARANIAPSSTRGNAGGTITSASGTLNITRPADLPAAFGFTSSTGVISVDHTQLALTNGPVSYSFAINGRTNNSYTLSFEVKAYPVLTYPATASGFTTQAMVITPLTLSSITSLSITSGTLPTGLSLDTSTGVITGTPTVAGVTSITITGVPDAASGLSVISRVVEITLVDPFSISYPIGNFNGYVNVAFVNQSPIVSPDGTAATFAVHSGTLPNGMSLHSDTGIISGTPQSGAEGTYTVSIRATKTSGGNTSDVSLVFVIEAAWTMSYAIAPYLYVDVAMTSIPPTLNLLLGALIPEYAVVGTSLPTGLLLDPATGYLSGPPTVTTAIAAYSIGMTFTNRPSYLQAFTVSAAFNVTVRDTPGIQWSGTSTTLHLYQGVSYTLDSLGVYQGDSLDDLTYTLTGSLPAGWSLDSATGVLSGTVSIVGLTSTVTLGATTDTPGHDLGTVDITWYAWAIPTISYSVAYTETMVGESLSIAATLSTSLPPGSGCAISPSVATGLSFQSTTGTVVGQGAVVADTVYTVTIAGLPQWPEELSVPTATFRLNVIASEILSTEYFEYPLLSSWFATVAGCVVEQEARDTLTPVDLTLSARYDTFSATLPTGIAMQSSSTGIIAGTLDASLGTNLGMPFSIRIYARHMRKNKIYFTDVVFELRTPPIQSWSNPDAIYVPVDTSVVVPLSDLKQGAHLGIYYDPTLWPIESTDAESMTLRVPAARLDPYMDLSLAVRTPHELLWSQSKMDVYGYRTRVPDVPAGSGVLRQDDGTILFVMNVTVAWQVIPAEAILDPSIDASTMIWPLGISLSNTHMLQGIPTTLTAEQSVTLQYTHNNVLYRDVIRYVVTDQFVEERTTQHVVAASLAAVGLALGGYAVVDLVKTPSPSK
jgi:Putative Ig domain